MPAVAGVAEADALVWGCRPVRGSVLVCARIALRQFMTIEKLCCLIFWAITLQARSLGCRTCSSPSPTHCANCHTRAWQNRSG